MCGLCGILNLDAGDAPPDAALVDRMTDSIAHRGPSDRGTWIGERVALGSRRLSVIDLSHAGRMPMSAADGRVQLVYNGEVYNFRELREKYRLDELGHVFRSQTDTEVLLHLYMELGPEMVHELNGMFAIAIWDGRTQQLHLARDRYGIKPLFYQRDERHVRFASEIKAIIKDPRVPRRPDLQALHDFLSFDYVPGAQTAFEGIREVPPGHWMTIESDGSGEPRRYWDLRMEEDPSIDEATAVRTSRELLERSLDRRLIADVPVGVFLSGGLDSSTIAALMARRYDEPIHTFSIGFSDPSFGEQAWARRVAEHIGSQHHEVIVTPERVRELLPHYLSFIDEPYGDGSAIPTYLISELAKDEVVVVLSGEGGDEAFAGYDTHAAYGIAQKARAVPRWFRAGVVQPLVNLLPVSHKKLSFEFKAKRFLGGLDLSVPESHMWWRIVLTEAQKLALYSADVRERLVAEPSSRHFVEAFARAAPAADLARILYIDSTVFLPDDLMIKNDRMTMAHSLEARIPFTDFELTEFMGRVPTSIKMRGGSKKHVLKQAVRDLLPAPVIHRKKVGLEMPYSRWMCAELRDLVDDYLGHERLEASGLFDATAVRSIVDAHLSGRADHGRALWGLLNYMMWTELYL